MAFENFKLCSQLIKIFFGALHFGNQLETWNQIILTDRMVTPT